MAGTSSFLAQIRSGKRHSLLTYTREVRQNQLRLWSGNDRVRWPTQRQLALWASRIARNVMLAGAKVIGPEGVGTPVSCGTESSTPSFSSFPFSSTRVPSSVGTVMVYRAEGVETASV